MNALYPVPPRHTCGAPLSTAGKKAGVNGTPAFFINGILISGALPIQEFKKVIDEELKAN